MNSDSEAQKEKPPCHYATWWQYFLLNATDWRGGGGNQPLSGSAGDKPAGRQLFASALHYIYR